MRAVKSDRNLTEEQLDEVLEGPTHDEIEIRAYERYLERGASDGDEVNDWLEAERELLQRRADQLAARRH